MIAFLHCASEPEIASASKTGAEWAEVKEELKDFPLLYHILRSVDERLELAVEGAAVWGKRSWEKEMARGWMGFEEGEDLWEAGWR